MKVPHSFSEYPVYGTLSEILGDSGFSNVLVNSGFSNVSRKENLMPIAVSKSLYRTLSDKNIILDGEELLFLGIHGYWERASYAPPVWLFKCRTRHK